MIKYDIIRLYFHRMDRAVKCSINGEQVLKGIKSGATQLRCAINCPGSIKIRCTFRLKDENIYLHDAYSWQTGIIWNYSNKREIKDDECKLLVPTDVSITIDNEVHNYSVADMILLEGFLCPQNQTS